MVKRNAITATVSARPIAIPSPIATWPARFTPWVSPAQGLADADGRRHADAQGDHEQDGGHLKRDLMRRQRRRRDHPHQQRGGREQAPFQHERDRDRRSDHGDLSHQLPVDAPEPGEDMVAPNGCC